MARNWKTKRDFKMIPKKDKKKKKKEEEWEIDENSDYPIHEKYTKEEPVKQG